MVLWTSFICRNKWNDLQSTLAGLGYDVELVDLMKVQIPVAIIAVAVAIVYYYIKDKQLSRKETK